MKVIIDVSVKVRKAGILDCEADLVAVGHFSGSKRLDGVCREIDSRLGGAIGQLLELGDFKGKEGTSEVIYTDGRIGAKRVLLVGLGERKKAKLDTLRKAAALAAKRAVGMKAERLSLGLHRAFGGRFDSGLMGQAMAEGVYYGSYQYDEYVAESEDGRLRRLDAEVVEPDGERLRKIEKGVCRGSIIGAAQSYARTVANRPGNVINPVSLAEEAKRLAKETAGLSCTVFDEKQLEQKGMGGILAVGSGSKSPPRFIVLKYQLRSTVRQAHARKGPSRKTVVGLVGKAITFDSGGISIKPSANMENMKLDKSGGLAVMGAIKAIAELKVPVAVYGIIPSAENMPSGSSWRPGDIVTTYSGKTVEVQNTDAEGRMILCDAIHYAVKQGCDVVIDIATLTGSCMVALGRHMAGLMANDEPLRRDLERAAADSGERVWGLPCGDEYAEEMKSKIADLKNVGGKWGGACTAAAFLRQFAGEKKWAHIDMAGMDAIDKAKEWAAVGATGYGVRLMTSYVMNVANS